MKQCPVCHRELNGKLTEVLLTITSRDGRSYQNSKYVHLNCKYNLNSYINEIEQKFKSFKMDWFIAEAELV